MNKLFKLTDDYGAAWNILKLGEELKCFFVDNYYKTNIMLARTVQPDTVKFEHGNNHIYLTFNEFIPYCKKYNIQFYIPVEKPDKKEIEYKICSLGLVYNSLNEQDRDMVVNGYIHDIFKLFGYEVENDT